MVHALEQAGAPGITVVEVHPVGYGFEANYFSYAKETIKRYFAIVKIEIVCHDEQVERLIEVILECSSTGSKGDGRIFVSPVERVVRIRDRKQGVDVL